MIYNFYRGVIKTTLRFTDLGPSKLIDRRELF